MLTLVFQSLRFAGQPACSAAAVFLDGGDPSGCQARGGGSGARCFATVNVVMRGDGGGAEPERLSGESLACFSRKVISEKLESAPTAEVKGS